MPKTRRQSLLEKRATPYNKPTPSLNPPPGKFNFLFAKENGYSKVSVRSVELEKKSAVFRALFEGQWKENSTTVVTDIKYEDFNRFVGKLLGQDTILESAQQACDFYYIAQKYDCKDEIIFAKDYMMMNVDKSNAQIIYRSAMHFDDQEIIQRCLSLYESDLVTVINNDGDHLFNNAPQNVMETMITAMNNIRNEENIELKVSQGAGLLQLLKKATAEVCKELLPNNNNLYINIKKSVTEDENVDAVMNGSNEIIMDDNDEDDDDYSGDLENNESEEESDHDDLRGILYYYLRTVSFLRGRRLNGM